MNIFEFNVLDSKKETLPLKNFKDKVILVVNVASKCGFTPQYAGLESLYKKYSAKGFVVLGFPCNQFGGQEPGSNEEIQQFCDLNFKVSFPLMDKIEVNGTNTHPLYNFLKSSAPGILGTEAIKWNFTKFLIGKDGKVLHRYSPQTKPEEIATDIELALK